MCQLVQVCLFDRTFSKTIILSLISESFCHQYIVILAQHVTEKAIELVLAGVFEALLVKGNQLLLQ